MKVVLFSSLITLILSSCASGKIEYNGECLSSCQQINMVYNEVEKTCQEKCKSSGLYRYQYKCPSSCSNKILINTEDDLDNICMNSNEKCDSFGRVLFNSKCIVDCKSSGHERSNVNYGECISSCSFYKYEDINENYCVVSCLNLGLYNHWPCAKNCKALGKYLNNGECVASCSNNYYLTEEENYCTADCHYHNMIRAEGNKICVETCKSVGQILGYERICQRTTSNKIFTFENEDYGHRYCDLFGLVSGPSSNCVKNCKEIGKVRYTNQCYDKCNYSNGVSQIYPYEYKNEIYCLSSQQCYNIGKYPQKINGINTCSDNCSGSNCISQCTGKYYSVPGKVCVYSCKEDGLFLYNNYCINACPIFANKIYEDTYEDICVEECPKETQFYDYDTKKCLSSCNELYIFNNMCVDSCPPAAEFTNIVDGEKYCVKNCNSIGLYNVLSEKICSNNCKKKAKYLSEGICFDSCISEFPYKYEGEEENLCVKNCSELGLLADIKNKICVPNCKNIGRIRYEDRCVSSCPFNVAFTYSTSEENYCVESCTSYGQTNSDLTCTELTCRAQGKTLFNGKCYLCPEGHGFKISGTNEDFCTTRCAEYGLIEDYPTSSCISGSLSCSSGKFKDFINNKCVDQCPDEIPYIKNSICLKQCDQYYYEDINGNKICTDKCIENNKYLIVNQKKCVDSCSSIGNYQLNGYNICYSKCNEKSILQRFNYMTKNLFSTCVTNCMNNDNTKSQNDCIEDCSKPFKYSLKDESNKICYQSCKEINKYDYEDQDGNYYCINNCKSVNKVLEGNKCLDKCPEAKKIKSESNGDIICKKSCENGEIMVNKNNEYICVNYCKDIDLILDDNQCVTDCPKNRPYAIIEGNEKKCSAQCDKYINTVKKNGVEKSECIDSCNEVNKYTNEKTCVNECPSSKNYKIAKNDEIFCSLTCDDTDYKYVNIENGNNICVKSCKSIGKVLYNGNCLDKCPNNKNIEINKNNEIECSSQCDGNKYLLIQGNSNQCVDDCTSYDAFLYEGKCVFECPSGKYLYENKDTNTKQCVDNCRLYNLFANDNKCVTDCSTYNKFTFEGSCLTDCPSGLYLYEDISSSKKQCIDDCRSHNLYINNGKCVSDCSIFNKLQFEGECMSQCPSDFSYSSNGICKSDPCEDGKFYDFFKKECIAKCDSLSNYKDVENNICVNSCKNIKSNKVYSIQGNNCIGNCNELNKYIYYYKNEYYCVDSCEDIGLLISEDGKNCVQSCNYDAYIKDGQCVESCDDLYINNNNRQCVEICPGNLPFIYNNECINSCYNNFLYTIYNTNICVDGCSNSLVLNTNSKPKYFKENYEKCLKESGNTEESCSKSYYLLDRENRICYQDCKQSKSTKYIYNNNECVGTCYYGIKEDNICNIEYENEKCAKGNNSDYESEAGFIVEKYLYLKAFILFFGYLLIMN